MDDRPHDGPNDRESDDEHWLARLLRTLESAEEFSAEHRSPGGISYDVSIGTGVDERARSDRRTDVGDPERRRPGDSERHRDGTADRPRSRRRRRSVDSDGRATVRRFEDELQVVADVTAVDPADVAVGFDGDDLVVAVAGRELERVDPPWPEPETETDARVNHGVLTVRVRHAGRTDDPAEGHTDVNDPSDDPAGAAGTDGTGDPDRDGDDGSDGPDRDE